MVEISEDFLRKIDNLKEGETLEFAMIYKGPQECSPSVTEKDYLHLQKLDKEYMNKQAEWYDEKHIPYRRFDNLNCFYATMNKDQAKELLENSEIEAVTIDDFL